MQLQVLAVPVFVVEGLAVVVPWATNNWVGSAYGHAGVSAVWLLACCVWSTLL
jgi:hypothetical protein